MEYWPYGCFCIGADFIASVVFGILAGQFFSTRYGLDKKAKKEMSVILAVLSTPVRIITYGLLLLIYGVILKISGLSK